ncbi:MAG: hypothetical protein H6935_04335 [Thiobacillus sp.]|nr:hypothetical protein [Thiobacillus sp.]
MSPATKLLLALCVTLTTTLAGCETYPRYGEAGAHSRDYKVRVVFSDRDRAIIRDYYGPHHRGLPPGLAKKGKVPPGHAMKLRRGDPVPDGYMWRPLPRDLEGRLSRLPEGYVRVVVGTSVGILEVRTRVVLDLLNDIAD